MNKKITQYLKLLAYIEDLLASSSEPLLIGIAGPPAAGKSTIAKQLVKDLEANGNPTRFCPMDGFHMTNQQLEMAGLSNLKGSIETFNVDDFATAVRYLKTDKSFWWPIYSRKNHNPISKGTYIDGTEVIYILEGNYLLTNTEPWCAVANNLDLSIFVDLPDAILRKRLLERHKQKGYSIKKIIEKINNVDMRNANMIRKTQLNTNILFSDTINY